MENLRTHYYTMYCLLIIYCIFGTHYTTAVPVIGNQEKYLSFSQVVSGTHPIKHADNCESEQWRKFLDSLYSKFSEYAIQKNRSHYNVADIKDWGKSGRLQNIEIHQNTFKPFLNKIAEHDIAEYDNILNMKVTTLQLEELNYVLNVTLKNEITLLCPAADKLVIKGEYIKFSDFVKTDKTLDNPCSAKLKSINIFALNTVFIDEDIEVIGTELKITIIAPKWEIINDRKITLDGAEGQPHEPCNAENCFHEGIRGKNGKSGQPGGPAGSFFGIGKKFINGQNLTITAIGGTGGPGQNGGDGEGGMDGYYAIVKYNYFGCSRDLCNSRIYSASSRNTASEINISHDFFDCRLLTASELYLFGGNVETSEFKIQIFGTNETRGGSGGHGGIGGKGGAPGSIVLFELNNSSEISTYNNTGKDGEDGIGGAGGVGGIRGDIVIASCYKEEAYEYDGQNEWKWKEDVRMSEMERGPQGMNGIDGLSIFDIEEPKAADIFIEQTKIINEYKGYVRENLNNRFRKFSLIQFSYQLNNNNDAKNPYDTLGLVNELNGLEEQFQQLNKDVDFLPFYQSLLSKISEYARSPKEIENSNQYRKVLNYLYTATLGRVYNLQDHSGSTLIIDLKEHLSSVKTSIESFKGLQEAHNTFVTILNKTNTMNKRNDNYKHIFNNKIEEAKNLIEEFTPEIENIGIEIGNEINSFINGVMSLQKPAKKNVELEQKKEELGKVLVLQGLFSYLELLGQGISFFGTIENAVGTRIGATSAVAESLVLNRQISRQSMLQLSQSIQLIEDGIYRIKDKEVARLNKLLEEISEETNKYPEKLSDVTANITEINQRLDLAESFYEVRKLNDEVKQTLKRKQNELKLELIIEIQYEPKIKILTTDQETANSIAAIEKCKQLFQLPAAVFDTYIEHKYDQVNFEIITDAIEHARDKFRKLKQYEENIYNVLALTLERIQKDAKEIASKLDKKSHVTLDVTKWQVHRTLSDMKLQMQQVIHGFKVKDNLTRCTEKLDEAMTVLINVYDHIQMYQDRQTWADYIAHICTTDSININVTDDDLITAVNDLKIIISSNLVLQQYQTAIDAFKQFVFPFAHVYLKELILPSHLQFGMNIDNLASKATAQIEQIKLKLDNYQQSAKNHDKYIGTGEFSSHYISTKPFFIWKNEQNKKMISKLLSGQEVVAKAYVLNYTPNQDAIKFNVIQFDFKSKNETVQSNINNILKRFKIRATHLGDSYYRYEDKIYSIITNSQPIWYYCERNYNGIPVHRGGAYDKIKNDEVMLSPYASWKIKLTNLTNDIVFRNLEIYKDDIDLELAGNGNYVNKEEINELDLMVEEAYKPIDTYNHLDPNLDSKVINTKLIEN